MTKKDLDFYSHELPSTSQVTPKNISYYVRVS
jgi:hypothetical protein